MVGENGKDNKITSNSAKQWSDKQTEQHQLAADLCCRTMDESFDYIRHNSNVSEYEVQQFILKRFTENNLVMDGDVPIVAFRENTSFVHYYPEEGKSKKLENETLIMIDLWARLDEKDAPYADITWMAWHGGDIPDKVQKGFDIVLASRDKGLDFIREKLNAGEIIKNKDLGKAMEDVTMESDMQELVPHAYGHSLGTASCHGKLGVICGISVTELLPQIGYTDEPGIYIEGKYGFRSEIDFLIDKNNKLEVTTAVQTELVRV